MIDTEPAGGTAVGSSLSAATLERAMRDLRRSTSPASGTVHLVVRTDTLDRFHNSIPTSARHDALARAPLSGIPVLLSRRSVRE
jgi:hypothetical protein